MLYCHIGFLHTASSCNNLSVSCLRIRRIDINDEFLALLLVFQYLDERLWEFALLWLVEVERIVEEVELEYMAVEQVTAAVLPTQSLVHRGDAGVHHLHICLVEGRCVDVVLVGQACQQVTRASTAIPDIVFLLPVLAKFSCEVFLR